MVENITFIHIRQDHHILMRRDAKFMPSITSVLKQGLDHCITWFWKLHVIASMPRLKRIRIMFRRPDYTESCIQFGAVGYFLAYSGMLEQLIMVQQRCSLRQHKVKIEVMTLAPQQWVDHCADKGRAIETRDFGEDHDYTECWWTETGADWISREGVEGWNSHIEDE